MFKTCYRGVAAVCLAAGMCLPAAAQNTSSSGQRQFTQSEHLMHHVIASHFGLTHQQVMDLHGRGYSYEDIATAANIASRSGRSLSDVVAMRDRPMEWPAIASQYGMAEADIYRGMPMRVAGARATMGSPASPGSSPYAAANTEVNWSRAYELTPAEMKRLRAKGLKDREIYLAANTATLSGRPVDDIVQMIFRGMTAPMIAEDLNLSVTSLDDVRPEWQTPEWEQAVREGLWYTPRPGTSMGTNRGTMGTTTTP
jgi:DNA-binding NarL/FixJ family response regulator